MTRRYSSQAINRSVEEPTINLTPLIDVVFVILIAFIVIARLLELDRIELADAPIASSNKEISVQETSPIALHVRQDNTVTLNGVVIPLSQLSGRLRELKKQYPAARPQLFHDRRAHFGTYQSVKNAAEAAGFQQMDIILQPA